MAFRKRFVWLKWPQPEEAAVSGKRTRVRRFQNEVLRIVQHGFFHLSGSSPEQEHDRPILFVENPDRRVGELLPADALMGIGLVGPDREHSVQKQNAFFCPFNQTAVIGNVAAAVIVKLLVKYSSGKAGCRFPASRKKQKSLGLTIPVIGILAQDHDLHLT